MKLKVLTIKELRTKKPAEISKYVSELRSSKAELLHAIGTNKDKQTHQLSQIKRTIARAYTLASETNQANKETK